ncbi:hypothetical protein [Nostoc sp.]|uniref:hypothetical protein n=1 Tax=Nostoc sp. TaxID=1180 RepID=UPI002FF964B8
MKPTKVGFVCIAANSIRQGKRVFTKVRCSQQCNTVRLRFFDENSRSQRCDKSPSATIISRFVLTAIHRVSCLNRTVLPNNGIVSRNNRIVSQNNRIVGQGTREYTVNTVRLVYLALGDPPNPP